MTRPAYKQGWYAQVPLQAAFRFPKSRPNIQLRATRECICNVFLDLLYRAVLDERPVEWAVWGGVDSLK